jgi:hypothetical protein
VYLLFFGLSKGRKFLVGFYDAMSTSKMKTKLPRSGLLEQITGERRVTREFSVRDSLAPQ